MLAVAEGEEGRRDRTDLQTHIAEEQRDVGDTAHLEQDRANPRCARRSLDIHQLLRRKDEGHLIGEAAHPVDAVDQCGDLRVGADLGELLVAAVHVTHDRIGSDDLLAVELCDDAQRAVGSRVLGTDVEGHALGFDLHVDAGVGRLGGDIAQLLAIGDGGHSAASVVSAASAGSSSPGICSTSTMPGHGFRRRASSG